MQQLLENKSFIFEVASMKANFFLQMVDFCIKELESRIATKENDDELQNEVIYKQIESLDDPYLLSLFVETEDEYKSEDSLQEKKESTSNKIKKNIVQPKPYFLAFKPKAPTTSYLLFLHENKLDIAARHKITNISQVTKVASEQWKKLPQVERQKYCKKAQEDKARYKEEMAQFNQKFADEIKDEKKRRQSAYKVRWMEKKKRLSYQKKLKPKNPLSFQKVQQNENESISSPHNEDIIMLSQEVQKGQEKQERQERQEEVYAFRKINEDQKDSQQDSI